MTRHFNAKLECNCCGETFKDRVLGSTSEFGYCDLDTRPNFPKRYSLRFWVHKCPNCGYVLQNTAPDSNLIEYIHSNEYQTSENMNFTDETADKYYKNALILTKRGKILDGTLSFLKAAWACDDAVLADDAIECRKRFLKSFDEMSKGDYDKTMELIRFDVLRRAGEFDILLDECDPNYFDDETMVKIAQFQRLKAQEKDTKCYSVEDAIS